MKKKTQFLMLLLLIMRHEVSQKQVVCKFNPMFRPHIHPL